MKALILAAGIGSRLAPITDNIPKALIPVNGKPIIINQIENLRKCGIEDITVISGYKSDIIKLEINNNFENIKIIESKDYLTTNNMYSAYLAKDVIGESDFIMMNADVFCDLSVIKSLIDFDNDDAIIVDEGNYITESMKVVLSDGKLVEISKEIPEYRSWGCSIDIYKFSKQSGMQFFNKCAEYINEKNEMKKWSEVALNDILPFCDFKPCPLNGRWFEIDDLKDLKSAEELFKN